MLCLLVITAALLARLTYKNSVEYDWTASGRHTLSDASLKILSKMPEKIEKQLKTTIEDFIKTFN